MTHGGAARYEHWSMRGADWVGSFSAANNNYTSIDTSHVIDTLRVINIIVDKYKDHPVVMGLEPGLLCLSLLSVFVLAFQSLV